MSVFGCTVDWGDLSFTKKYHELHAVCLLKLSKFDHRRNLRFLSMLPNDFDITQFSGVKILWYKVILSAKIFKVSLGFLVCYSMINFLFNLLQKYQG